jgi:cell wall-associated NlpC family hydrolase
MRRFPLIRICLYAALAWAAALPVAVRAEPTVPEQPGLLADTLSGERVAEHAAAAADAVTGLLDSGFALLGIKYRFGGNTPQTGFDCSGFVRHVFSDALGVLLPRTAVEMARVGARVGREDLQPGDLVFFNTLSRAFSHVGIYMGDDKFMHANSRGGSVRIDDMTGGYWSRRFNGARRVDVDGQHTAPLR